MLRWSIALLLVAPLFAQEADEAAFSVSGTVQLPNGKPAQAAVYLWDAHAANRLLAEGRTDAKGNFVFEVSRLDAARREHPFGPLRLVVHRLGLARHAQQLKPGRARC